VLAVSAHTYIYNRLWGHPVYPIGQTYESPGRREVLRFRRFASSYGGLAPSWWDWQETSTRTWAALGATSSGPPAGYRPVTTQPLLKRGSRGDLVVWAQEHLVGAGQTQLPVTGIFGRQTVAAVRAFQLSRGLAVDGAIGTTTWSALLGVEPARPRWAARRARTSGAATSRMVPASRPASASLPAKAYEIDPGPDP
jgi:Putative peptidoglycan binding domain